MKKDYTNCGHVEIYEGQKVEVEILSGGLVDITYFYTRPSDSRVFKLSRVGNIDDVEILEKLPPRKTPAPDSVPQPEQSQRAELEGKRLRIILPAGEVIDFGRDTIKKIYFEGDAAIIHCKGAEKGEDKR